MTRPVNSRYSSHEIAAAKEGSRARYGWDFFLATWVQSGARPGRLDSIGGMASARAGLRPYDIITALDDQAVGSDDDLIRAIAARAPGSAARVTLMRDARAHMALQMWRRIE